jgi:hypothetical protein
LPRSHLHPFFRSSFSFSLSFFALPHAKKYIFLFLCALENSDSRLRDDFSQRHKKLKFIFYLFSLPSLLSLRFSHFAFPHSFTAFLWLSRRMPPSLIRSRGSFSKRFFAPPLYLVLFVPHSSFSSLTHVCPSSR